VTDDIVLNKLKDHADLARHVEEAGWKLRIGNRGPEIYPNLFQDAVDEIERLRAALRLAAVEVFGHRDPTTTSPDQLVEHFIK